ncbi:MAG TPA: exodeoxyribonuclease VII large subunit [Bacteroidota bacterium]
MNAHEKIVGISELTRRIKRLLEGGFSSVAVQGEVSNFKHHHPSGHLYFTLKDENASLSAVMWRSRASMLPFMPVDGMKVVASGRITVYEVRGNYQLDVLSMRPLGTGDLQIAFEKLKQKLFEEGLFAEEHKLPLPEYPERIGIVTSPTGAVLQDMLNVLRRRFPGVEVVIAPVKVQGPGAASEIAEAIRALNMLNLVDIIVLARGGGSLEDLWPFNEEIVARAIYASILPVVSAIGHEVDYTIADFVADMRAPTPSAAAELIVQERNAIIEVLRNNAYTMQENLTTMLKNHKESIRHLLRSYTFNKPLDLLRQMNQRIDEIHRTLGVSMEHIHALTASRMNALQQRIEALNPELVLKRGYAMVYRDTNIISSSSSLHLQDEIRVRFRDGEKKSVIIE